MFRSFLFLGALGLLACASDANVPTVDAASAQDTATSPSGQDGISEDAPVEPALEKYQVRLVTTLGAITLQLNPTEAPITCENFIRYVKEGFYDGKDGLGATTFHRVIEGFMIQGGGFTANGNQKSTHAPIKNEASNGLWNVRGSIAMARTNDPDSATAQFFINHVNNAGLNYGGADNPGYAVFGEVVEGMDVVDAIAEVATGAQDRPVETVSILSVAWSWD